MQGETKGTEGQMRARGRLLSKGSRFTPRGSPPFFLLPYFAPRVYLVVGTKHFRSMNIYERREVFAENDY